MSMISRLNDFELAILRKALPPEIESVLLKPFLSEAANQARITMRIKETDPNLRRAELVKRFDYAINEAGFKPEQVNFSGILVLYNNMLQSLFTSQIVTTWGGVSRYYGDVLGVVPLLLYCHDCYYPQLSGGCRGDGRYGISGCAAGYDDHYHCCDCRWGGVIMRSTTSLALSVSLPSMVTISARCIALTPRSAAPCSTRL